MAQLDRDVAALVPDYQLHQVKEKFGGLRYYVALSEDVDAESVDAEVDPRLAPSDRVDQLIAAAEAVAARTCEQCGQPGQLRGAGWMRTVCDTHAS